jgi:cob(I)alamin adenosyltransferase
MSIVTKTGDDGTTRLLFNRKVDKRHPRVEVYGTCDELNSAIGFAKSLLAQPPVTESKQWMRTELHAIQLKLVILMGELAVLPEDLERFENAGHKHIVEEDVENLTRLTQKIESEKPSFENWATPGHNVPSAALDVARTVCRRVERRVFALDQESLSKNPHMLKYLNRLSDLLWLMARKAEGE